MGHVALGLLFLTTAVGQPGDSHEAQILISSPRAGKMDLFLADPATGTTKNLTATADGLELWPAWSADGKRIACVTWTDKEKNGTEVTLLNADGSDRKRLTASEEGGVSVCPTWSPDGKRIAYGRVFATPPRSEVRAVNVDGTNDTLVAENAAFPAWSPDGARIAFARMNPTDRTSRLAVMKPDGSDAVNLTDPVPDSSGLTAAWSPDGKWIAFPAPAGNSLELHLIGPDGKNRRQLTHLGAGSLHPVWLTDDTLLCTHLQPQGGSAYLSIRADGTRLHVHPLSKMESAHAMVRPAVAYKRTALPPESKPDVRPVSHTEPAPAVSTHFTPVMMFRSNGRVLIDTVWAPGGTSFAWLGSDGHFGLADVSPTAIHTTLEASAHPAGITAIAWAHDGKRLYTTGLDKAVRAWNPTAKEPVVSIETDDGNGALALHPKGTWVATAGAAGAITVREPETLKPHKTFAFAENKSVGLFGLAWSNDGKTLFAAGGSGLIPVLGGAVGAFDPQSGEARWRTKNTLGSVSSIMLSPDGTKLAGACGDTFVRVWEAGTGKELQCLKGHGDRVAAVAWSPDGKLLASCGLDHTIRLWDAGTGQLNNTLSGHLGPVFRLHFSPDGKRLASAGMDRVLLWKAETP